ncbi:RING finger protein PFE0100w-like [Daktulosphaira vitifoliae]|uniref:RING finger protein PFE0100w-like n=1 Tax=Daktulosphaira vitifoliae TaxID=58002 RepID=UPI0021AA4D4B|nr:RING finger protein PFE0100w-like [Daktulosphaira vitifoliae]
MNFRLITLGFLVFLNNTINAFNDSSNNINNQNSSRGVKMVEIFKNDTESIRNIPRYFEKEEKLSLKEFLSVVQKSSKHTFKDISIFLTHGEYDDHITCNNDIIGLINSSDEIDDDFEIDSGIIHEVLADLVYEVLEEKGCSIELVLNKIVMLKSIKKKVKYLKKKFLMYRKRNNIINKINARRAMKEVGLKENIINDFIEKISTKESNNVIFEGILNLYEKILKDSEKENNHSSSQKYIMDIKTESQKDENIKRELKRVHSILNAKSINKSDQLTMEEFLKSTENITQFKFDWLKLLETKIIDMNDDVNDDENDKFDDNHIRNINSDFEVEISIIHEVIADLIHEALENSILTIRLILHKLLIATEKKKEKINSRSSRS